MFASFAGVWSPVAIASAVVPGRMLRVVVADTPVVLFRDEAGRLAALVDRCPHRGVALSLGQVRDGCVVCPFHGWEFEGDGACAHVPMNPRARALLVLPALALLAPLAACTPCSGRVLGEHRGRRGERSPSAGETGREAGDCTD